MFQVLKHLPYRSRYSNPPSKMAKPHHEGNSAEPHKVFLVPEVLEMILLETDTRTLLVSCQRVCHLWQQVIKDSIHLQAALFFKPMKQSKTAGTGRIHNTLLDEIVWPEYLRSNIQSDQHRWPGQWSKSLPTMKREREEAFTRPEASWRRMLRHQQPQFHFAGLARREKPVESRVLHYITIDTPGQLDLVRMEDITSQIHGGLLIPCQTPWTFVLTESCEKVPDVAKLDQLWDKAIDGSTALLYDQYSITALLWIPAPFTLPRIFG